MMCIHTLKAQKTNCTSLFSHVTTKILSILLFFFSAHCSNITTCFLMEADGWLDPPGSGMYGIGGYEGNGQWVWIMNSNIRLYGDFWGYFAYNIEKPEHCLVVGTNPTYTWQLTLYFGSTLRPKLMWPAINEDQCTSNYGYGCELIQFSNSIPATTKWVVR